MSTPVIDYCLEPALSAEEFVDVLERSTLAERRPVADLPRVERMLRGANLIVTARVSGAVDTPNRGTLVGVSRALTDFAFCVYLSDLAVDRAYQGQGIGRALLQRTHSEAGPQTQLILLAAPKAETYYPHIGLMPHHSCWTVPRQT